VKRLVLLVALAFCPSAQAVTLVTPDGQVAQPYQRWTAGMRVPGPTGPVEVVPEPCPARYNVGVRSCADPSVRPVRIYLNPPDVRPRRIGRFVLFHELGHVFDFARTPGGPWTETFANVYAFCAFGWSPTPRGMCGQIRRAGGWFMRPSSTLFP
jgi:hypothetical protein